MNIFSTKELNEDYFKSIFPKFVKKYLRRLGGHFRSKEGRKGFIYLPANWHLALGWHGAQSAVHSSLEWVESLARSGRGEERRKTGEGGRARARSMLDVIKVVSPIHAVTVSASGLLRARPGPVITQGPRGQK